VGHYNSFLVRVWTEEGKDIRGSVQHVGTQEIIHFKRWDKMVDFIQDHLDWQIGMEADLKKTIPSNAEYLDRP